MNIDSHLNIKVNKEKNMSKVMRFTSTTNRFLNYLLLLVVFATFLFYISQHNECSDLTERNSYSRDELHLIESPSQKLRFLSIQERKLGFEATMKSSKQNESGKVLKLETSEEKKKTNQTNGSNGNQDMKFPEIYFKDMKKEEFMKNISKPGGQPYLFTTIPDEEYLEGNRSFFMARPGVSNDLDYPFFIGGENVCGDEYITMLIIIPSVASHLEKRNAIRRTWLGAGENNSWPGVVMKAVIKHIFLLGGVEGTLIQNFRSLNQESQVYNDIVMAAFQDSYRNLTIKGLVGLRWAQNHCSTAQVILKVDEDTVINIPLMLELLQHVKENAGTDKFVLGLKHKYPKPYVVRKGRWGVTQEEYPLEFFPHYLYGHTYAISRAAAEALLTISKNVMFIAPEDAFITGILPRCAGVSRLTAPSFTVCCRNIFDCEIVWNKNVAITTVDSVEDMEHIWTSIVTHTCNPEKAWKVKH